MHRGVVVGKHHLGIIILVYSLILSSWIDVPGAEGAGGSFGGGDGSAGNPYVIEDVWDLQNMNGDLDAHYVLKDDIDASMTSGWNSGAGFEPFGTYRNRFTGSLDGRDHTITGLYINRPAALYVGIIGYTSGSSVKNVGLIDCNVTGQVIVGGLVGTNSGTVSNCYATGNVSGDGSVGGLVGWNPGTVSNCYATSNVSGGWDAGGLVGANSGTVSNCYATSNVSGDRNTGGLMGFNGWAATVSNCYASGFISGVSDVGGLVGRNHVGTVSDCYASGFISGAVNVGGLVGRNYIATVSNCSATGNVNGTGDRMGGLIGWNTDDSTVSNCYATGNVNGTGDQIGGLVGATVNSTVSICYATGKVSGSSSVGGLMGANDGGTVSNCFWDIETSGTSSSDGGTGKTTSEMMTRSTFTDGGWDLTTVWCMVQNVTYPLFRWQDTESPTAEAGPDQRVFLDANGTAEVMFNGSESRDDIGIQHEWSFDHNGSKTRLHGMMAEFVFRIHGIYHVTLTVIDAVGNLDTDTMVVTVLDLIPPIADAGPNQTVDEGTVVTFDGGGSWDNEGVVGWTWTFNDGGPVTLHDVRPTHRFDSPGTFVVTLRVQDAVGKWATDAMTVTVEDITAPVADAGIDRTVDEGAEVTFDGSGSGDNVGVVNWTWTFIDGGPVSLHGVGPTYQFNVPGVFVVTLNVTDAMDNWASSTVTITVTDITPPVADAGSDQTINEGVVLTFDGSESWDNARIFNWTWTFTDGWSVTLHGARPTHRFDAPGAIVVTLEVADAAGNVATDTMTVTVNDITPPTADAGSDLTVDEGTLVMLDGFGCSDNVGIVNYTWTLIDRDPVTLYGTDPSYMFDDPGDFVVRLNVTDGAGNWNEDAVTITVRDITPPEADAGGDRSVPVGTSILLNGSASTDNVGTDVHTWTFTYDGQARSLDGAEVRFTFDVAGPYEVVLTVADVAGNVGKDTFVITVVGTGRISGIVLDEDGKPVEGVTVEVTAADGSTHEATTAANGSFSLDIPHGGFTWRITKEGYGTVSGISAVAPMGSTELDLADDPLARKEDEGPGFVIIELFLAVMVLMVTTRLRRR